MMSDSLQLMYLGCFREHLGLLTIMPADTVVRERYAVDERSHVVPIANVIMSTVNIPLQENE